MEGKGNLIPTLWVSPTKSIGGKDFKIEFLTQRGVLSGAKSYDYEKHILEGFHIEDFKIDKVNKKNRENLCLLPL